MFHVILLDGFSQEHFVVSGTDQDSSRVSVPCDVAGRFEVRNTLSLALTKTALRGRVGALGDADGRLKVRQEVCHLLPHLQTELLTLSLATQLLGQSAPSVEHLPLKTPGWECKQKV